jgi:hypothetical protein
MVRWSLFGGCCVVFLSIVGCGAADPTGEEVGSADPYGTPRPSQEEIDAQTARIRQSLGEASCATTQADYVLDVDLESYRDSASAIYGHPTCQKGFVVDVLHAKAGRQLYGQGWQTTWEPFTCLLNYGYVAVYQKQGATYTKVGEKYSSGTWNIGRTGPVCQYAAVLTTPADGDYKVVVSAGNIFGGLYFVRFLYF